MVAFVKVVSPHDFNNWLSQQQAAIKAANDQVTPLRTYLQQNGNL
jgi:heme/copper-type cytochrome/quinol oxidase subunit 2